MFVLQNKDLLINSYERIIQGNLKPKEVVYTDLQLFVMFGALEQVDMDNLMNSYHNEEIINI